MALNRRGLLSVVAVSLVSAGLAAGPPAVGVIDCLGRSPTHVMGTGDGSYNGTEGNDVIVGSSANDTIFGLEGDDYICGRDGNDTLWGGAGVNHIAPGPGDDQVFGNSNLRLDHVSYATATGPVVASLKTATVTGEGTDDLSFIRILDGSPFADDMTGYDGVGTIYGGPGNDTLRLGSAPGAAADGQEGDDTLLGGPTADTLSGGPGADVMEGNGGDDQLYGDRTQSTSADDPGPQGNDVLRGGADDDGLFGRGGSDLLAGGPGDDVIDGAAQRSCSPMQGCETFDGSTADVVTFAASTGPVTVNLTTEAVSGEGLDEVRNVEQVVGSAFADALTGSGEADRLDGAAGPDTISGADGTDVLLGRGGIDALAGDGGDDSLTGGAGSDSMTGGTGTDTARFSESTSGVVADLAAGSASGEGSDTFGAIERLVGSSFADVLRGNALANTLSGGGGPDRLVGRDGTDSCLGGPGRDTARTCEVKTSIP